MISIVLVSSWPSSIINDVTNRIFYTTLVVFFIFFTSSAIYILFKDEFKCFKLLIYEKKTLYLLTNVMKNQKIFLIFERFHKISWKKILMQNLWKFIFHIIYFNPTRSRNKLSINFATFLQISPDFTKWKLVSIISFLELIPDFSFK